MSALGREVQARLDEGRPELAWRAAAEGLQHDALQVREHARRLLHDLTPLLPLAAWTEAHETLAVRLHIPQRPRPLGPGVARFPAVFGRLGRLVTVTVSISNTPQDALPAGHEGLRQAFDAARSALGDPTLRFSASFDPAEGWDGASAGLALGLAAVSAAHLDLDLSLIVATGGLNAAGDVMTVGQIAEKQGLCREAAPRATLLTPRDAALRLPLGAHPVGTLHEALRWAGHGGDDPVRRLILVRGAQAEGRWEDAAALAEPLLADLRLSADQLGELLTVCLAAANHSADAARQATLAASLTATLDELDGAALAQAVGNLTVKAIDALDLHGAAKALSLTPPSAVKPRHRVHLLGPAALLHTLSGEHHEALHLREQALKIANDDERPRAMGDLADALMRAGHAEEARSQAQAALQLATKATHRQDYQRRTSSFLRLHLARALALLSRRDEALAELEDVRLLPGLDPALRGKLLHAELTQDLAAAQGLHQSFGASGLLRALTLRTLARLGDGQATQELLALPVFAGLSVEEAARRLPY
ncbi:MAG: hypothetical protein IPO67_00525 [Deltaproteobacteria bacterium]|nr:hypothetical protein [Deltaproteobacteria bacterium]